MASYMDLQSEFSEQTEAFDNYRDDLRLKIQKIFSEFKTYLDLPAGELLGPHSERLPYVDLGQVEAEQFRPCTPDQLALTGSCVDFAILFNFVHNGTRTGVYHKLSISKKDFYYTVALDGQTIPLRVSGVGGKPDFTKVFEALSSLTQEVLRRRP